jgi:ferredoxin/flavodoxin---NADP+ reductase
MKWIQGRIAKRHVWSEGLFTLGIQVDGLMPFEPGQFLQIGMQNGEDHLHRPYSVASPHGPMVEFFIVKVDGGALTPRLWEMREGDPIDVSERAAGSFTLKHAPDAECLWLIGTGTGLAPYIAMLRTDKPWNRYKKIVVIHGVRHGTDLAYQDEMAGYEKQYSGRFKYLPVVSRQQIDGALSGRITNCLDSGLLEETVGQSIKPDNAAFLLCGNPDMLDEMEAILGRRGLQRNKPKAPGQIVVERYW